MNNGRRMADSHKEIDPVNAKKVAWESLPIPCSALKFLIVPITAYDVSFGNCPTITFGGEAQLEGQTVMPSGSASGAVGKVGMRFLMSACQSMMELSKSRRRS